MILGLRQGPGPYLLSRYRRWPGPFVVLRVLSWAIGGYESLPRSGAGVVTYPFSVRPPALYVSAVGCALTQDVGLSGNRPSLPKAGALGLFLRLKRGPGSFALGAPALFASLGF